MEKATGESIEGVTVEEKALATYLILLNIFEKLSFTELKSIRFVNSFWNKVSLSFLEKKSVIQLVGSSALFYFIQSQHENPNSLKFVNYFIQLVDEDSKSVLIETRLENNEIQIFQEFWNLNNLKTKELHLDLSPNFATKILKFIFLSKNQNQINEKRFQLWKLKVRVLKFFHNYNNISEDKDSDDVDEANEEHEFRIQIEPGIPGTKSHNDENFYNLTNFEYINYSFDESEFQFPIKWDFFFEKCRFVKELFTTGISDTELTKLLNGIIKLQQKIPTALDLEKLQILNEGIFPDTPRTSHLEQINAMNFTNLKSIELEIGPEVTMSVLEVLLKKYKDSLHLIQFRRHPFHTSDFRFTTTLSNVTILDISDKFLPSLEFLHHLPQLKSLRVRIRDYSHLTQTTIFENSRRPPIRNKVTALIVDPLVSVDCVRKIIRWFPDLKTLKLRVDDLMARLIFMGLEHLEDVHFTTIMRVDNFNLQRVTLTDEGITGIPFSVLQQQHLNSVNPEKDRCLPYIGNLHELKYLTIESWHGYVGVISDFSICFGFINLPYLQTLRLIRTMVSQEGFRWIRQQMNSLH